jgi:hypothetical protein
MTVEYAQQYGGQNVVAVRDAHASDPGYEKDGDCVVATLADGSVVTVKKSQLTTAAPAGQGSQGAKAYTGKKE